MTNPTPDPSGLPGIPEMSALWGKGDKGDPGSQGDDGEQGAQGIQGIQGVAGESALVGTAETLVAKLVKADKRRTWQVRILGLVCVVLVAVSVFTVKGYFSNRDNATGLRADSVASCVSGNTTRALDITIWDSFINLLLKGNTNATANAEGKTFEQLVQKTYAPRDCQAEYANVGSTPASPASNAGDAAEVAFVTPAVTSQTQHLQSWDGACLSIPNANVGTRVYQVTCGTDHAWTYYSTGQLSPQGHDNVEVGDSGGELVLKATGSGTDVYTNSSKAGPGGYVYDQLYFGVPSTYWHANGNGEDVTFDNTSGDDANYWVFLGTADVANASTGISSV